MRPLILAVLLSGCTGLSTTLTDKTSPTDLDEVSDDTDLTDGQVDTDGPDTDFEITNSPPVADAGEDFVWALETVATLDGSGSSDPDEHLLNFQWTIVDKPAGSSAVLLNDNREDPSFYADREGDFVMLLEVDDGIDADDDEVTVTVVSANLPPVAVAGQDQAVDVGSLVQLNGSGSFDPDNDPLEFAWIITNRPGGSASFLVDGNTATPRFTPDVEGTFLIELRVTDGDEISSPDSVRVIAQESSSGDCLSCAVPLQQELDRHATGTAMNGAPWLLFFPLSLLVLYRKKDQD